nr:hypothetical protein [uncultured Ottowia sp.]
MPFKISKAEIEKAFHPLILNLTAHDSVSLHAHPRAAAPIHASAFAKLKVYSSLALPAREVIESE